MMDLFDFLDLFRGIPDPQAGEHWAFQDNSPWGSKYLPVTILDVRNHWVRYKIGSAFPDERMRLGNFKRIYKRVEP